MKMVEFDRAAAMAALAASPTAAALDASMYEKFKTKMNGYHATMHEILVADPKYEETVARLAAGEQIQAVATWLSGFEMGHTGACVNFTKAFIRQFEALLYPDGAGLDEGDAKLLAEYMTIDDVLKVFARAKESRDVFGLFDIALDAAGDVVDPLM